MSMVGNIIYAGLTDVGKQRSNNEDTWVCRHIWDENTIIAAVIDGVGGYEGGEVAAQIAAKELVAYLEKYPNGERAQLLKEAIVYANNRIFEERSKNQRMSDMGCVITSVLIEQDKSLVHMAHVGDTRLYEYQAGCLIKRSHDQSPIGRYEEMGLLNEKEAMEHPMRNIIERDLGRKLLDNATEDYIETATFSLNENSSWLLCSDGLTDMLIASQIMQILADNERPDEQARSLIDAANDAGGKDNITVVILYVPECEKRLVSQKDETIEQGEEPDQRNIPAQESQTGDQAEKGKYCFHYLLYIVCFVAGWIAHSFYVEIEDAEKDTNLSSPAAQETTAPLPLYQSSCIESDSVRQKIEDDSTNVQRRPRHNTSEFEQD